MPHSSGVVGRFFSLLPLMENSEESKVLFVHFLLLLAERDVLANEVTSLQPKEVRLRMFKFYNSVAKADWDRESAHVFSSLFPLAFKHSDTFEIKEISLKTSVPLSTSYIDTRRGILHNLKDGLAGASVAFISFRSLLDLSLSYVEGGVALLEQN
ncbi:hypothetical protein GOP47_0004569 [Adiantum capillus-veneris]|uniref:Uncharacterized protein n=1 Tax=Adiantum capillus-veneris TaxID=13818 RepID=A0A9D4ZPT7_ADICA|nr:hypothetical protein GOP47_0004569 [Adiantum capillus-veneris]